MSLPQSPEACARTCSKHSRWVRSATAKVPATCQHDTSAFLELQNERAIDKTMTTTFLYWRTQEQPKHEPRDYVNGITVRLVKHKQASLIRSTLMPSWYANNSEQNDDFKDHQRQTLTSATDAGETGTITTLTPNI